MVESRKQTRDGAAAREASYFYFLSFAKGQKKRHGIARGPPQRRRGSLVSKAKNSTRSSRPRPSWDNTIHDLSVWKLSAAELEAKKRAYKSSFRNRSAQSIVISTEQSSPPSLDADDRSGLSSHDGSTKLPVGLAQVAVSPKTSLTIHVISDDSSREELKSVDQGLSVSRASKECCPDKRLTNGSTISRFGKENTVLKCLPAATKIQENVKRRPKSSGFKTPLIFRRRKITHSSPARVSNSSAHSSRDRRLGRHVSNPRAIKRNLSLKFNRSTSNNYVHKTSKLLVLATNVTTVQTTESSTSSSATTVDFEDEVRQFEAEKKQRLEHSLYLVTKPRRKISYRSPRTAVVGEKRFKRIKESDGSPLLDLKLPFNVMDKSSPTRYTHQPTFRRGVIDSSDDSISGPLESLGWQKGTQFATKNRRHQIQKNPEVEGSHPTKETQSFSWEPQPQKKELVNFKGESNITDTKIQSSRSGRTKRHFGNVQKTSPIMEWNGELEGDTDDQFSLQKDLHRYLVKCHREVMKEFKDLKLSISRQIVNLQLDVDKILENQKAASPKEIQGRRAHYPGSAAGGNIPELVDESQELAAYSSLKFRQELIKPASPSSGESCHLPSSKLRSKYTEAEKEAHFDSWPQEESHHPVASHKSYTAPTQSHVFRNLQNNPIYHVHTSSDKRAGSSDSDISISSFELAELRYRETMDSLMETKAESDARQCSSADELDNDGVNSRVARSQNVPGLQSKKSNGNSHTEPMATYGELTEIGRTASPAAIQRPDISYRDSKLDNNGHSRSHHVRTGRLAEQSRNSDVTVRNARQPGFSKTPRKDAISVSNQSGTYTGKGRLSHEDVGTLPDIEPHLCNPGRSSPRPAEKKSRSASRPLFSEEAGKATWDNLSTTTPMSNCTREHPHQNLFDRKGEPDQGRFTYSREEPQNQKYEKAVAEERQPHYTREESQDQRYDMAAADQPRRISSAEDPQSKHYGNVEAEQDQPIYNREELHSQQYGRAGIQQGRPAQAREQPQNRQYGKAEAEQERTRSPNSKIEKQGQGEPFTLRGWAAAFLEPPTEITIKSQEITLQSASPKTDRLSSGRDSPIEQSVVQESPKMERQKEKGNGSQYGHQYAVRQFAGKSSRGGVAWTVSEPTSPKNSQKGSPANGTPISKVRQKHHYPANNH